MLLLNRLIRRAALASLSLWFAAASANAQKDDGADEENADADAATADDSAGETNSSPTNVDRQSAAKPRKAGKKSGLSVRGRVFVRNTASKTVLDSAQWRNSYDVSSARVNVDLRKYGWLRGSLEAEFSDNDLDLKDVYLRAALTPNVSVIAGNFKRPMSPLALESIWRLPVIERGILSDRVPTANYVVPLNLGGRSQGAMVSYERKDGVRPRVDLGLFNARLPTRVGSGAEIADQADNLLRDVYLRGRIEPIPGFSVGATVAGFTQARFVDDLRTRLVGSLDVTLDTKYFRAWLEGFAGRTPFFDGVESVGGLLALRVLAAGRLHRPTRWLRTVEPYVLFSALDPSDKKQDNRRSEVSGGIAAYFRRNLRLQLEYSRTLNEDEFPQANFAILDAQTIRIQLGARFR